ncbi:Mitochondrial outer membrane protein IML2 [Meyerozyma sp. JA9]|nr:Mitochondrial outer membrane protein IML2 [Meyerozyma sp. JA9]
MFKGLRKKASALSLTPTSSQASLGGSNHPQYSKILKQVRDFEIALRAMDFLLDDRAEDGMKLLEAESKKHAELHSDQPAGIFPLAMGVMDFIEATLGFEPDVMARAHDTLSNAEAASLANSKYNTKHHLSTSTIYPPGTEFQVTLAESTLLNALVMLLTENNGLLEAAKALLKLRKAYQTLDSLYKRIKESEPVFERNLAKLKRGSSSKNVSTVDLPGFESTDNLGSKNASSSSLPEDVKLMNALEQIFQMRKSRVEGTNLGRDVNPDHVNLFKDASSDHIPRMSSLRDLQANPSPRAVSPSVAVQNSAFSNKPNGPDYESDEDDDEFTDALETLQEDTPVTTPMPIYMKSNGGSRIASGTESIISLSTDYSVSTSSDLNSNHLHVSTIDEFIHSGVQLCFGILQVVLSLIPPTIGKVLSIVGFKGDFDAGMKMLWRTAITSRNIHGELALLCLLVFYDGPIEFIDNGYQVPNKNAKAVREVFAIDNRSTVSDEELKAITENPSAYTPQLLERARTHFKHNALWILQQGRMLAAQGNLDEAISLMQGFTDDPNNKINMRQIEGLFLFDRSMLYAFRHSFDECARDFVKLVDKNSWSQGLYLFFAGCSYLEKYRMIKLGLLQVENEQETLQELAKNAEYYMKLGPTYIPGHGINAANKKGGIGGNKKQLPFDKYLLRKMTHLEEVQKQNPKLAFIDCVGTSPYHEIIYFWNGYNRMPPKELELSLKLLGYSGAPDSEFSANTVQKSYSHIKETMDEAMLRYFFQAMALRSLGRHREGLALLDSHVISKYVTQDSPLANFKFTKMTYSPFLYPTALYEKSRFVWKLRTSAPDFDVRKSIIDCETLLKKAEIVSDIGDYEMSSRTSMNIKASIDRVTKLRNQYL